MDDAGRSFAESCALAGKHCALSDLSSDEILRKLDSLIDHLYVHPEPVTGLASSPHVGVAHARHLREFFTSSLHRIDSWPAAARVLADAFDGNYTTLLDRTLRIISPEDARDPDPGEFNIFAIAVRFVVAVDPPSVLMRLVDPVCRPEAVRTRVQFAHDRGRGDQGGGKVRPAERRHVLALGPVRVLACPFQVSLLRQFRFVGRSARHAGARDFEYLRPGDAAGERTEGEWKVGEQCSFDSTGRMGALLTLPGIVLHCPSG